MSPALPPSHGGSQLFIYHAQVGAAPNRLLN